MKEINRNIQNIKRNCSEQAEAITADTVRICYRVQNSYCAAILNGFLHRNYEGAE